MHWHELLPAALRTLHLAFTLAALALVPLVLVRRKEPSATIAWILALVFLPAAGALLFLMFGRDRVRMGAKRKRATDRVVGERVEASRQARASSTPAPSHETSLERALFQIGERLSNVRPTAGNGVQVLSDGESTYAAIGAAIDAARHHVHAQYYLIRDDATGRWFRERLVAAARRGVQVRLLMDGFGCFALGPGWTRPLRAAGGKVGVFLPMHSFVLQPVNLRNHRKIVVVDGATAFTGGYNVGDEYKGQMRGVGVWRDVHLRIDGPAAHELQRIFFQDWTFATGEAMDPSDYFSPETEHHARGSAVVAIVPSGPDTRTEAIHRLFFAAISGAEREVVVTTPYFVPTESLLVAMEVAALRGVALKIVLPARSNHRVTFHAGRSFYSQLLAAGVELLEYRPGIVHAKTLVADSRVSLVGSANMDMRSFRLNFEVHAVVHDQGTANTLRDDFARDVSECARVDGAAWARRSVATKVAEGASRLVSPLL